MKILHHLKLLSKLIYNNANNNFHNEPYYCCRDIKYHEGNKFILIRIMEWDGQIFFQIKGEKYELRKVMSLLTSKCQNYTDCINDIKTNPLFSSELIDKLILEEISKLL